MNLIVDRSIWTPDKVDGLGFQGGRLAEQQLGLGVTRRGRVEVHLRHETLVRVLHPTRAGVTDGVHKTGLADPVGHLQVEVAAAEVLREEPSWVRPNNLVPHDLSGRQEEF